MAKRKAEWENKSRFKHARSVVAIGIVLVLAAALILAGVLLAVLDRGEGASSVSAINLESDKIGMTADLDNVFVKIVYSDGSSRSVTLAELMPEGLDLTYSGRQTVTINYGNQKWSLPVEVVSSKIKIEYITTDGGYVEGDGTQEVSAGESGATVRAVASEGYHFTGWDDGVLSETRHERSVSQNLTIRAMFERNSYTVGFQRADGRWDEQTVLYGDAAVPPDSDTWKMRNYGYKFIRWDQSVAGELDNVTRDLLVRGEYEQYHTNFNVYVTGNPNNIKDRTVSAANHTYGSNDQKEEKNSTVTYVLDGKSYTRRANLTTGFYEWKASPASVIAINAAQDSVLDCWLVKMRNGNWQKIEVGGSANVLLPGGVGDASEMVEFSSAPQEDGVYKLTFTLEPLIDKDAKLEVVAVMEYERNDIIFYNRAEHVKTVALPYDETLSADDFPVLENPGYVFDGWIIRNSETVVTTDTYFKETTIVDARWIENEYSVRFKIPDEWKDKGCGFAEKTVIKKYLSAIGGDFPATSPACSGYDFAGWFVEGEIGGSAVTEATIVLGDMVLVPSFTPKRHTVRFDVRGGNARIYAEKDGGTRQTVGSGSFVIEEPSSYLFTVEWDAEYVFNSLEVDGIGVTPIGNGNSFSLSFNKNGAGGAFSTDGDRNLTVVLADAVFALAVKNGSAGVAGTVEISGSYGGRFTDAEISVDVPMHAQVMYKATAPAGYVIDGLKADGANVFVSENATEYTGIIGDVREAHGIEITYKERKFNIVIRDGESETSKEVVAENPFDYEISSPDGQYASKVTLNGRTVDLYRFEAISAGGYYIDKNSLKVNKRGASSGEIERRDDRVTAATLKIDKVAEDAEIVIEYADLEYTLTFKSEGYGTVLSDPAVKVKRNADWAVVLSTATGYYIAGYKVSSYDKSVGRVETKQINYNNFAENHTEEIKNVTEDADYTFIFGKRVFDVIFAVSGGSVDVSYGGETFAVAGAALLGFGVEYGASARFNLTVAENKIIKGVSLISEGGSPEELETGSVESDYTLVLDKITEGYRVFVTVSDKPAERGDGKLTIEKVAGGKVTAPLGDGYVMGEELVLTVIPEAGYEVGSVIVVSAGRFNRAVNASSIVDGKFTVTAAETASAAGAEIKVTPDFKPKNFDITLKIEDGNLGRYDGYGKIAVGPEKDGAADKVTEIGDFTEKAAYGTNYYVYFIAEADSIISEIRVDGVPVELNSATLEDYTMTAPDGGYSVARISVKIAGTTVVSVVFRKETFNVTVTSSYNGTTEIVNASDGFLKGEDVLIGMTADTGYHISGLYIDGIKIDEKLYLNFTGDDAKLNAVAKYTFENISRNITVAAQYEMNYYSLGFTAKNVSQNFAAVNTTFASYGKITAKYESGDTPVFSSETDGRGEYNAALSGIAHGTYVYLDVLAAVASGYYIKNLSVRMLSGDEPYELIKNGALGVYDENAPVYATATGKLDGELVFGATLGIRGEGGITADVYSVYVEFARAEYEVSVLFGDGANGKAVGISFVNSYNNGQAAIYREDPDRNGIYIVEFGIQTTIILTPEDKFRLAELKDSLTGYDYTFSVISNRYTGLISGNVNFVATYEVRQMNVNLSVGGGEYGSAGIDGFSGGSAVLPYGSELRLILIPETERGGIIDSLLINGGAVTLSEENGIFYYIIEEITSDISAEAYFELKKFTATQSVNVTAGGSIALTDRAGNQLNDGKINWGDTLSATITVNRAYNLVSVKVNGANYDLANLKYEETNGIRRYTLEITNVRGDYAVGATFELKVFEWEADFDASRGDVYLADENGVKLENLTANSDVYLYVNPKSGYMVSAVSARMRGFDGNYVNLTLDADYYGERVPDRNGNKNLDVRRYSVDDVTGIVVATVDFGEKEFTLRMENFIGVDGMEKMEINVSHGGVKVGSITLDRWSSMSVSGVRFDDTVTFVAKAREGYDVVGVSVNGKEYLSGRHIVDYNVTEDQYTWIVKVSDELVNNLDEQGNPVIGGNTAYNLKFTVAAERDSFKVELKGNYEGMADVSVSERMSYGSRNNVTVKAHTGYSITSVKISKSELVLNAVPNPEMVPHYDERLSELSFDLIVDGSHGVFCYHSNTGVMDKFIYIEINAEINSYNQSVAEYVHDNEKITTDVSRPETEMIASKTTAFYIDKDGMAVPLENLTSVDHFLEVTVETNPRKPQDYEFWGFQEYIEGRGWIGEIENVTYEGGSPNKFKYAVDRARVFRAVYVKRYAVEAEIVPFHKYLSGSYIPETGTYMSYATYGSIGASVTDPFGLGTTTAQNLSSSKSNFVYEVCYGDVMGITASDSNSQNRSRTVNYYAEKEDGSLELLSSGSMGMTLNVEKNMRIYAAFDNNIQFAMTAEAIGGEKAGEGAKIEYSVGNSARVPQNNAVSVNAFDKVRVKVTLDDNYRFESLLSLEAQNRGELGTLIWTSTWETLFDFEANGADWTVNDLKPEDSITVTRDGNVLTFEFTVTENAIYKLVLHRMFTVEISENNGYDNEGNPVAVAGGASLGEVSHNDAPEGWFDYGATVVLDSNPVADAQFVGWFVNETNYFDLSAQPWWNNAAATNHSFTLSGDRVAGAKNLDIRAEYLPIYELNLYRGLEYEDGRRFYGSTDLTSVKAVEYDGETKISAVPVSAEAEENFNEIGVSMSVLSHIVSFAEKNNLSKVSNKITLTVRPKASFVFSGWSIKVGNGTNSDWKFIEGSGDKTEFTFDLVEYLYKTFGADGAKAAARDIYFRANITKNNVIRVSKVVYYDAEGVISPNNGLAENNAYVGDSQTVSTVEYGQAVTVSVSKGNGYSFIGWFDITNGETNDITQIGDTKRPKVTEEETYRLTLEKGAGDAPIEGYTYYYEARFMRMVTVKFAVENNSANGNASYKYQVPVIKGTPKGEVTLADGTSVTVEDSTKVDTATAADRASRHTVTFTSKAGTYVAYKLPTDVSVDGFSPDNQKYLGLSSGSYVERGENDEYVVVFDRNRTITVLYGAYGTINLEALLPNATMTFGKVFTNLYLDQNGENPSVDTARYSLTVSGGRLTVRNKTEESITVPLPNMPKVDYQIDKNSTAAESYEKVDVHVNPMKSGEFLSYDISIGFSYASAPGMTLNYSLTDAGIMPFSKGAGTSSNPYIICSDDVLRLEQLRNVGRVYTLSGNTFGNAYRYFAMETKMRNGSPMPESQKFLYLNEDGNNWQPLCSEGKGFDGVFDFKDWEIGGLTGTASENYFGVFAKLSGATVRSFNFGGKNNVTGTADYVGFIAGYAINTVFEDINVKDNRTRFLDNNTSVGTIGTTGNYLGLLAGYAESCRINNGVYLYAATVQGGGEVENVMGEIIYKKGLYVGAMFGYLKNTDVGTTSNNMVLAVNNVTVGGHKFVGGVAGYFEGNNTVRGVSLISGTFGTRNVSGNVGGIVGYLAAGARMENVSVPNSASNSVTVHGIYRPIDATDIENNNIERYLYSDILNAKGESSIGGFVGRLDGTMDRAEISGSVQIYGSVAGGMVGFNKGTVKNLRIYDTADIRFELQFGGVYGGMVGYNDGLISYTAIGRLNKHQGLSEDMGRIVNYENDIIKNANILFKTKGSASVSQGSGNIYANNGDLIEEWGGLAMGGVAGYNTGRVFNSVNYGKIVHFKKVESGSYMMDALGGIVGMNRGDGAKVISCGTSYGIVIGYTVVNVENGKSGTHRSAVGGIIGSHSGGIALAMFTFHSAVTAVTNAGAPNEADSRGVLSVASGVAGLVSGVPGTAVAPSYIGWAYYNEKSFDEKYFNAVILGHKSALASDAHGRSVVNFSALSSGYADPGDYRYVNIADFTNYNYNVYVNSNTGHVYNVKAKAATLGDFRIAIKRDNPTKYDVNDYYTDYAKVYAVDDQGNPTKNIVPWQYDTDDSR